MSVAILAMPSSVFSHSGKADIESHLKSNRHKNAVQAASKSKNMTSFFKTSSLSAFDLQTAACEGVWAYHMIKENHSFRSADCANKIIRGCFELSKFHCARTKCEALVTNVFAPYLIDQLKKDLEDTHFVTILTDASNHGNIKMFPVLVRYFHQTEGVKVRIIEFSSEKGSSSEIIFDLLKKSLTAYNIEGKLVGFCGDNENTNFGGLNRGGQNNVFYRLKSISPKLIGVGCAAHIVHNTLKCACDGMPFDVELFVVKIYSHFYLYTVRVTKLKEFCDSVEEEYKKLLGYSKTRFLALLPAIESILRIYESLKEYFLNTESSPLVLKNFFSDPLSKIWLLFLKDQSSLFSRTITRIESDNVSAMEVGHALNTFIEALQERKTANFLSAAVQKEIQKVALGNDSVTKESILLITTPFYETAIEYISKWTAQFDHIMLFAWTALDVTPEWEYLEASAKYMAEKNRFDMLSSDSDLFDQFSCLKKYVTNDKIQCWEENCTAVDQRWVEIFGHFSKNNIAFNHLLCIVSFVFCLPGTSATVERVFAIINKIWTIEKTRLQINTLKNILFVKYNLQVSCLEFFNLLKSSPKLLEAIAAEDKYTFKMKNKTDANASN